MKTLDASILFLATTFVFSLTAKPNDQNDDRSRIDGRIQQLRQTLLERKSPDSLLSPSLAPQARTEQGRKAARQYVAIQLEYNVADLRWQGANSAELPVRVHWETATSEASLTGTIKLDRVDNEWYFRTFDFLHFPWDKVIWGSTIGVIFMVFIFLVYFRLRARKHRTEQGLTR